MNENEISSTASRRKRRIQKVSGVVRAIFLALLIIEVIAIVAVVIALPIAFFRWSTLKPHALFDIGRTLLVLPLSFMFMLNFFRLFGRLKDGHLFEGQTIRYLELAGKWWIVAGVLQAILQIVEAYFYTPHNITFNGDAIFGGLVVFFIAWVMREGQELKEEQELTV